MHYYPIYIVKAENKENAFFVIEDYLQSYEYELYDYYEVSILSTFDKNDDDYKFLKSNGYKDKDKVIVEINEKNILFLKKVIKKKIGYTEDSLETYKKSLVKEMVRTNQLSINELTIPNKDTTHSLVGHYLQSIGSLTGGYLSNNVFFYDFECGNINISDEKLKEYVENGGYYVIFLNMHN